MDFEYHWRGDQDWPQQTEVETLAEEYDVDITSWVEADAAVLGGDGTVSVEQDNGALGTTYTTEYREVASGATFFSEFSSTTRTILQSGLTSLIASRIFNRSSST